MLVVGAISTKPMVNLAAINIHGFQDNDATTADTIYSSMHVIRTGFLPKLKIN